jgi:carbonic anhydrase
MHRLRDMLAGNDQHARAFETRFDDLQEGQTPAVVTVCCSDSRVLQDHIWGNDDPGYLFTCGNIGNRVVQQTKTGERISGDVLYPIAHTETDLAVVVGHTGCGAVTAAYDALEHSIEDAPGIEHCVDMLKPHLQPGVDRLPDGLDRSTAINYLVEYNVDRQVELLEESSDVPDDVIVAGVVYDFQDVYSGRRGQIHVVNVDGETENKIVAEAYPEIADRMERLWDY